MALIKTIIGDPKVQSSLSVIGGYALARLNLPTEVNAAIIGLVMVVLSILAGSKTMAHVASKKAEK